MKKLLEIDARCVNCKNWVFEDENEEFLESHETYCNLTKELKKQNDECDDLDFCVRSLEYTFAFVEAI
jgi:hypothetical protein